MYDGGKIIAGLLIFTALMAFPFWYNAGTTAYATPKLQLPPASKATECIRDAQWMREEHMQLLDDWRDEVVRNGKRLYTVQGKQFEMSLQNTCMDCHDNKAEFCDKCHDSAAVTPYCWDCHVVPAADRQGGM